jgi:hypothetical protein
VAIVNLDTGYDCAAYLLGRFLHAQMHALSNIPAPPCRVLVAPTIERSPADVGRSKVPSP